MKSSKIELLPENSETIFPAFPWYQIKDKKMKKNEDENGGDKKWERTVWGKNKGGNEVGEIKIAIPCSIMYTH